MWIRLRQIAVVASDLRAAAEQIGSVLCVEACYTDPGVRQFGLKNMLWPIGSQFLEVVTPIQENTAAGRYIARRHGDGGYMVINQVDDIAPRRKRAAELGIRVAFDLSHPGLHDGIQLHPGDTGGSFFEMDQMLTDDAESPDGAWYPAGPNWQPYVRTDRVTAITAAELQSPEPDRLAQVWSDIAEIDLTADDAGNPTLRFANATLRFVEDADGRGEGLGAIDVAARDPAAVVAAAERLGCAVSESEIAIVGLRVNLVDSTATDNSGM